MKEHERNKAKAMTSERAGDKKSRGYGVIEKGQNSGTNRETRKTSESYDPSSIQLRASRN